MCDFAINVILQYMEGKYGVHSVTKTTLDGKGIQ